MSWRDSRIAPSHETDDRPAFFRMPLSADFLDRPLGQFLETVGREALAPGGGSVAALTAAMSAGLVTKVARGSAGMWEEAGGAAAQAEALRARLLALVQTDAEAYEAAMGALRGPRVGDAASRDAGLATALSRAADVPAAIAEAACDVALLAAAVADAGEPDLRADAATAAVLAEAGVAAARLLVQVNLVTRRDDERLRRVDTLAHTATGARAQAVERVAPAASL